MSVGQNFKLQMNGTSSEADDDKLAQVEERVASLESLFSQLLQPQEQLDMQAESEMQPAGILPPKPLSFWKKVWTSLVTPKLTVGPNPLFKGAHKFWVFQEGALAQSTTNPAGLNCGKRLLIHLFYESTWTTPQVILNLAGGSYPAIIHAYNSELNLAYSTQMTLPVKMNPPQTITLGYPPDLSIPPLFRVPIKYVEIIARSNETFLEDIGVWESLLFKPKLETQEVVTEKLEIGDRITHLEGAFESLAQRLNKLELPYPGTN